VARHAVHRKEGICTSSDNFATIKKYLKNITLTTNNILYIQNEGAGIV
jgi:hypothetical protein